MRKQMSPLTVCPKPSWGHRRLHRLAFVRHTSLVLWIRRSTRSTLPQHDTRQPAWYGGRNGTRGGVSRGTLSVSSG